MATSIQFESQLPQLITTLLGSRTSETSSGQTDDLSQVFTRAMQQSGAGVPEMQNLIQAIFAEGSRQIPGITAAYANASGLRTTDNSGLALALNDLNRQMTTQAAQAILDNQNKNLSTADNAASQIAQSNRNSSQVKRTATNPLIPLLGGFALNQAGKKGGLMEKLLGGDNSSPAAFNGDNAQGNLNVGGIDDGGFNPAGVNTDSSTFATNTAADPMTTGAINVAPAADVSSIAGGSGNLFNGDNAGGALNTGGIDDGGFNPADSAGSDLGGSFFGEDAGDLGMFFANGGSLNKNLRKTTAAPPVQGSAKGMLQQQMMQQIMQQAMQQAGQGQQQQSMQPARMADGGIVGYADGGEAPSLTPDETTQGTVIGNRRGRRYTGDGGENSLVDGADPGNLGTGTASLGTGTAADTTPQLNPGSSTDIPLSTDTGGTGHDNGNPAGDPTTNNALGLGFLANMTGLINPLLPVIINALTNGKSLVSNALQGIVSVGPLSTPNGTAVDGGVNAASPVGSVTVGPMSVSDDTNPTSTPSSDDTSDEGNTTGMNDDGGPTSASPSGAAAAAAGSAQGSGPASSSVDGIGTDGTTGSTPGDTDGTTGDTGSTDGDGTGTSGDSAGDGGTSGDGGDGGSYADGGQIKGPGTETSDSILANNMQPGGKPIAVSDNEYILPPDVVRFWGTRQLDMLKAAVHTPVNR